MMGSIYTYNCIIKNIVDGDTVDIDVDLGFDVWLRNVRVRIDRIDAPEVRTRDLVEKHWGKIATKFLEEQIPVGSEQRFVCKKYTPTDSFGRVIGDFEMDWLDYLSDLMIDNHHAVHWQDGDKETMKKLHEQNRLKLIEKGYPEPEV